MPLCSRRMPSAYGLLSTVGLISVYPYGTRSRGPARLDTTWSIWFQRYALRCCYSIIYRQLSRRECTSFVTRVLALITSAFASALSLALS